MSLVQMSTTSTERIVRQVEMKLDRLVDMVNSGGLGSGSGGASPRSRRQYGTGTVGTIGQDLDRRSKRFVTSGKIARQGNTMNRFLRF